MTGPVGYWHVEDIKESLAQLLAAGATEQQAVSDVGGGKMMAAVTDTDGNVIGLIQEHLRPGPSARSMAHLWSERRISGSNMGA